MLLCACTTVSPPAAIALEIPALPASMVAWYSTSGVATRCDAADTADDAHEATGAAADATLRVFVQTCLRTDKELFASPSAQQHKADFVSQRQSIRVVPTPQLASVLCMHV